MRIKRFLLVGLLLSSGVNAFGQSVNPFTGSFSYGQKVLKVPSNRGPGVDISVNYNAGIQMNQPSSEIGLGWNINAGGAIYRGMLGLPDDTRDYAVNHYNLNSGWVQGYGSMYPSNSNSDRGDFFKTRRGLDSTEFTMPAFDNFIVDGPGIGGRMKLSYHKFYSYNYVNPYAWPPDFSFSATGTAGFKRPQFHFEGEFADTLVSRHYSVTLSPFTPYREPTDVVTGNGYTSSNVAPFIGRHLNGSTITSENFDSVTTRLGTASFIEYFTNHEIDSASTAGFTSGAFTTFVDFKSVHSRTNSEYPADGIGYFRITSANGITYHYSLPVYHLGTTIFRVPLDHDYSPESISTTDFTNYSNDVRIFHPGNLNILIKDSTANKYAIKWLLTAVTGADYEDSNNDHMVNDGDKGYWLSYDYRLWSSCFIKRSPEYGYDFEYMPEDGEKYYPQYFPFLNKSSGLFGVSRVSRSQVYYLNKIRTSSHTALFVRDIRNDEKGGSHDVTIPSNFKPAPDLLLKRVVLFKNEQLDSILPVIYPSGASGNAFNTSNYSDFNFDCVTNTLATSSGTSPSIYTENWFNANFPNSNPAISSYSGNNYNFLILKNVFFSQDYSLCRNYHGNVKVNYNNSSILTPPSTVEAYAATSTYSSSGKLTLNKVYTYDFANVKVTPSVIFDYNKDELVYNSSLNPNFNPRKTDYWGYYKSDATANGFSRYTSSVSKGNTNVWSLKSITDHLGGITEIEYESNSYNKVLDNESSTGFRGAAFIYRVNTVEDGSSAMNFDIYMEESNSAAVSEFSVLCGSSIANIKKRMCLPIISAIIPADVGNSSNLIAFAFGNVTTTLTSLSGNNIQGTLTPLWSASTHSCFALNTNYNQSTGSIRKFRYDLPVGTLYNSATYGYEAYCGNGFLLFETPVGYEVYGGGIRVKTLRSKNSTAETYVKEYSYADGVASEEADRFDYPRLKAGCAPTSTTAPYVYKYDFLQPKSFSPLDMSPMVGYSKVTIKDLGRINTSNGKIEISYITDPTFQNNDFRSNNTISTVTLAVSGSPSKLKTINECVNVFANIFGAEKEINMYDKNDNVISKVVNTYTPTEQGALVENVHFVEPNWFASYYTNFSMAVYSNTVNILRDIPVVLKHSTSYGMGSSYSKTQNIARDELTGKVVEMSSVAKGNSNSYGFKTPAYKCYQAIENVDFTSENLRRLIPLGYSMYSYGNVDSTLTPALGNGSSASFLSSDYKLYSRKARQRLYNQAVLTNSEVTLPSYYCNRTFGFDGGPTSLDDYGLYDKTLLANDPLPLSTISNTVFWEPVSSYNWKLTGEITLLDNYKHVVETRDQNNRFSAGKYGYNGYYKNSSASNCNYASYTFADFETTPITNTAACSIDGDLIVNNHTYINNTTLLPHTGLKCIQVGSTPVTYTVKTERSAGNSLDIGFLPGRIYRASVWTHSTNLANAQLSVSITGSVNNITYSYSDVATSANTIAVMGNWYCMQMDIVVPETFTTGTSDFVKFELKSSNGSNVVYFDDFVLHPVESSFAANVYNPRTGRLMSSIDGNGLATNYKYDAAGRILEIWKEIPGVGYKQVKSYNYNYARGINN
jgi:YD repeat-containing protein